MISKKRKIIWLNSPYNQDESKNIVKIFLKLVDKYFPCTHRLHKIFYTIKVRYNCMSNRPQLIKKRNSSIQKKKNKTTLSCKFRDRNVFPLNENCRTENVFYKCTSLTKNNVKKVYLGVTEE